VGPLWPRYWYVAQVVSILPAERRTAEGLDRVITLELMRGALGEHVPEALVLRTWPNDPGKRTRNWSGYQPTLTWRHEACAWLRSIGVKHLLLDLPSVDRERDEGLLAAHHAFWNYPET
jgi:arylformamidase